jgi:hypothetical protein
LRGVALLALDPSTIIYCLKTIIQRLSKKYSVRAIFAPPPMQECTSQGPCQKGLIETLLQSVGLHLHKDLTSLVHHISESYEIIACLFFSRGGSLRKTIRMLDWFGIVILVWLWGRQLFVFLQRRWCHFIYGIYYKLPI